ncbi:MULTISPECIES: metallophosphoesterase [unclassified Pseudomonas]|uniref:metallophosphoesterase n=1 Tax=unclassified Pseudomonas TaxID=196821 RepID=UPI002AC8EBC5|nr:MULTISPECIES: metallophosphoesterase [unclassified Pseudomonas]MEB0039834.1 metallophosphoesterase [Pseudomonas sp. MH10]MEB0120681.1 metallophosphoesterase [Pseudomonas sp. CCI1.2]WPX64573.1 metallophosphoesterase [Pseudomonas sp. MH10]
MSKFQHCERNMNGRDFAVGDIHGHFTRLRGALNAISFDSAVDRLFSVGDIVDRGPESKDSLEWLAQPWFFAVQGNHEALAIQHVRQQSLDYQMYRASGGTWFLKLSPGYQRQFAARFADMPIAIEVETSAGLVGIVHADCPSPTWQRLRETLSGQFSGQQQVEQYCQWSRERLQDRNSDGIPDIRALLVGHSPLRKAEWLGNVLYIDTGGWRSDGSGYFTLVDLATLEPVAITV